MVDQRRRVLTGEQLSERAAKGTNPTLPRYGTDPILGWGQYRNAVASGRVEAFLLAERK